MSTNRAVKKPEMQRKAKTEIGQLWPYADTIKPHVPETGSELNKKMLSDLPAELLEELRHAIIVLDRSVMADLTISIKVHAPDTAQCLQMLVDSFKLGRIREIVGRMEYWSSKIRYSL